ncbi:ribonuclease P [Thermosphaera chiliense]|uniref:Ribonuclease P n=1 Tax=Thermosphaera chiliense TaxID=3402707 RepID=A0A7M1UQN8_9CREN|nr:ribonuclease P [Thermosphaera aggregans]QOR94511.1 ribonuclease P [Thermosphaera aggregans]
MFTDLNVKDCSSELLEKAAALGYSALACWENPDGGGGVRVVGKKVLSPRSLEELKQALAKIPVGKTVVSVSPRDTATARWSAHDGRVDTIVMTLENIDVFDKKQFSTMKYYGKPLEIWLSDLRRAGSVHLAKYYRRVNLALRMKIPVVTGSGASDWSQLPHPRAAVYFLTLLLDFPEKEALLSLTSHPYSVIAGKVGSSG